MDMGMDPAESYSEGSDTSQKDDTCRNLITRMCTLKIFGKRDLPAEICVKEYDTLQKFVKRGMIPYCPILLALQESCQKVFRAFQSL
jgi:hypothetical protein